MGRSESRERGGKGVYKGVPKSWWSLDFFDQKLAELVLKLAESVSTSLFFGLVAG
jgi:hypothetical protein